MVLHSPTMTSTSAPVRPYQRIAGGGRQNVTVRFAADDYARIKTAAETADSTVAGWLRHIALEALNG